MRVLVMYGIVMLVILGVAAKFRPPALPAPVVTEQTGPMALPMDYRTSFIQYEVVDRPDNITRTLYISRDSFAALQRGEPLPNGTRIIIEGFHGAQGADGRLVAEEMLAFVHMAEKRRSWRLDELHTSAKVGDWNFASFDATTGAIADPNIVSENLNDCFTCHDSNASPTRDFIFSRRDLDVFANTQTPQYVVCNRPERLPCR